jgi:hypothetical protein
MRTCTILLLLAFSLPMALPAQPNPYANDSYYIGDIMQTINCNNIVRAVRNVNGQQRTEFNGHITNNELLLTGGFNEGVVYEVIVLNMIGAQIFTTTFTAYGRTLRFDMAKQINPGIYMVSIGEKNDPSSKEVLKVVKQ